MIAYEDRVLARAATRWLLADGLISEEHYKQIVSECDRVEERERRDSKILADLVKAKLLDRLVG